MSSIKAIPHKWLISLKKCPHSFRASSHQMQFCALIFCTKSMHSAFHALQRLQFTPCSQLPVSFCTENWLHSVNQSHRNTWKTPCMHSVQKKAHGTAQNCIWSELALRIIHYGNNSIWNLCDQNERSDKSKSNILQCISKWKVFTSKGRRLQSTTNFLNFKFSFIFAYQKD